VCGQSSICKVTEIWQTYRKSVFSFYSVQVFNLTRENPHFIHITFILLFCETLQYIVGFQKQSYRFDFGPSVVRVLPLAAGRNEGGHYFRYFSTFLLGGTVVQNTSTSCV
jgi:hypothetical protein